MPKRIIYSPPSLETVDTYAQNVCEQLRKMRGSSYTDPKVVHGFAAFVELATTIWAKHLNKESEEKVDSNKK